MQNGLRVGIVGTGLMGKGLARNVIAAGYDLSFLQRTSSDGTKALEALGGHAINNLSELVRGSDVLLICVRGTPDVEGIMLDEGGVLDVANSDLTVIDFTTALPASTRKLAGLMQARGGRFIDAAMTGLPSDAEAGEVSLIAGCEAGGLGEASGILDAVSKKIYFAGSVGSGHAIKLLHQGIVLSNVAVLAEAYACAKSNDVDVAILAEVIGSGGADSKAFQRLKPAIKNGEAGGFEFSLGNAQKDMAYYCDFATGSSLTMSVSAPVAEMYSLASKDLGVRELVPSLLEYVSSLYNSGESDNSLEEE